MNCKLARWGFGLVALAAIACGAAPSEDPAAGAGSESEDTGSIQEALSYGSHGFAWVLLDAGAGVWKVQNNFSWSSGSVAFPSVAYLGTGLYSVTFSGLNASYSGPGYGGNVQVVATNQAGTGGVYNNTRCKVSGWSLPPTQSVTVACHGTSGAPADSPFVVHYFQNDGASFGKSGYVWTSGDPSSDAPYNPDSTRSGNTAGGSNTVDRTGVGLYKVTFGGLAAPLSPSCSISPPCYGGNPQITAYGSDASYCKISSWGPAGADQEVYVRCYGGTGALSDARFSLNFDHRPSSPFGIGAHAWTNDMALASYTPDPAYSYNSDKAGFGTGTNLALRQQKGVFQIRHFGLEANKAAPHVSAYGMDNLHCKIEKWGFVPGTGRDVQVETRCWGPTGGAPQDSLYQEVFISRRKPDGSDFDGDGYTEAEGDCNDVVATIYPGAPETCNDLDDDCDGTVDEGACVSCPTIVVNPPAPFQTTGTFNTAYPATGSMTFTQTGSTGSAPTWTATGLPTGVTLGLTTGTLSGTPTQTGVFNAIMVTFLDELGCTAASGPHSISIAPRAENDTYAANVGNTQVVADGHSTPTTPFVAFATNPLANDAGPPLAATPAVNAATTLGGSITLGADGKFTYTPEAGDTGTDTFTYTVTSNGVSSTATISIGLGTPVWFVNNTYAGGNGASDGRSHRPFTTMNGWNIAANAGHSIFVHTGAGTTTGAITLEANQTLWGQGAPFTLGSLTIAGAASPTLGGTVTLANAVTVNSLTINSGANPAITGGTIGTATINAVTVAGGTTGLSFTGGNGNVNWTGGGISGVSGLHVSITGRTGGTVAFGGSLSGGGTGVFLNANTGATINFTGGVVLTAVADAFTATGGGTVTVTGASNTLTATAGTALNVTNTTIGANGLTFRSISSVGGTGTGIILDGTGTLGGLTVTGTGTAGSGGSIQNKTGTDGATSSGNGVYLNNTSSVSLSFMQISGMANFGILGTNVTGFTLASSTVGGTNGNTVSEGSIFFHDLRGNAALSTVVVEGGAGENLRIENDAAGSCTLSITGSTFQNNSTVTGGDGVLLLATSTANLTADISDSFFVTNHADHVQVHAEQSAIVDVTLADNTLTGDSGIAGVGQGIVLSTGSGSGQLTFDISGNTITGAVTDAIAVFGSTSTGATSFMRGTIANNIIGSAATNSGSANGSGIGVRANGLGTVTVAVTGNNVQRYTNFGILLQAGEGSAPMNATVTGNTVLNPNVLGFSGLLLNHGLTAGPPPDAQTSCIDIRNNTLAGSGANGSTDVRVRQRFNTTVRLPGYAGSLTDTTAVIVFIAGQNPGNETVSATVAVPPGGGFVGTPGGAACPAP